MSEVNKLDDQLRAAAYKCDGVMEDISKELGIPSSTAHDLYKRRGLKDFVKEVRNNCKKKEIEQQFAFLDEDQELFSLHKELSKTVPPTVEQLADKFDCAPKKIKSDIGALRERGYKVTDPDIRERVQIQKRSYIESFPKNIYKDYFDGEEFILGMVADTHLSSKEEALAPLHEIYDIFEEEGISTVYHGGDWTAGVGVYPIQVSDLKNHTYEEQISHMEVNYPKRNGIKTIGIAGNHDIEGAFGRLGANPVIGLANRREDIDYIGDYNAYVEVKEGAYLHLLHGRGGGGNPYAYTQKIVNSYTDIKPVMALVGHYHISGNFRMNDVEVIWPGCFEWRTNLMYRLHLLPAVGGYIISGKINSDNQLVEFKTRKINFHY